MNAEELDELHHPTHPDRAWLYQPHTPDQRKRHKHTPDACVWQASALMTHMLWLIIKSGYMIDMWRLDGRMWRSAGSSVLHSLVMPQNLFSSSLPTDVRPYHTR